MHPSVETPSTAAGHHLAAVYSSTSGRNIRCGDNVSEDYEKEQCACLS